MKFFRARRYSNGKLRFNRVGDSIEERNDVDRVCKKKKRISIIRNVLRFLPRIIVSKFLNICSYFSTKKLHKHPASHTHKCFCHGS